MRSPVVGTLVVLLVGWTVLAAQEEVDRPPIDVTTAQQVEQLLVLPHNFPAALAFSPDGNTLTAIDGALVLRDWDTATGEMLRELELVSVSAGSRRCAISPDGQLVAASLPNHEVGVWRTSDGERLATFSGDDYVMGVQFSPDSALLAIGWFDGDVELWNVDESEISHAWRAHPSAVHALAFSPDMSTFVTGSINATWTIRVWNMGTWEQLYERTDHQEDVYRILFVENGAQFVSASGDRTAMLWDTASGTRLRTYGGHYDIVNDVAVSPNGDILATAASDNLIRLWDFASGDLLATLRGHTSYAMPVVFSPRGDQLASAGALSSRGEVILWGVP